MKHYSDEIRSVARSLYLRKWTPKEIARELNLPNARIIYYWSEKYAWRDLMSEESVEEAITRRINVLSHRDNKNETEIRELDLLIEKHVKLIAIRKKPTITIDSDIDPIHVSDDSTQPVKKRRKRRKNDVSDITEERLNSIAEKMLYPHQLYLRENKLAAKIKFVLKSRQIGLTFYYAFEAFEDAILTGNNQIFVSASKAQARVFASYIKKIAQEFFDLELKGGDVITLSNGANFIFVANNIATAQSYSGNVYLDEVFWMPKFKMLYDVSGAMATHKHFRITLFSTASAKTHQAYAEWSGDNWRGDTKKRQHIKFPADETLRMNGQVCPDTIWRCLITVEDAVNTGFDRIDIQQLRDSKSEDVFNLLYMCIFIDSADSVFKLAKIEKCIIDASKWEDFNSNAPRPFDNREVWGGYDPSRTTDTASFVVVAPPIFDGEKFRVLEIYKWQGLNFKYQTEQIKKIKAKYNMTYIGVDITGIGRGVFELIQSFAQREATAIHYSLENKSRLVLKMIDVIDAERIEWSDEHKDLPASFLAIKRTTTASGNAMTFMANRSDTNGHADDFFAISHAIINEPINFEHRRKSTWSIQQRKAA